MIYHVLNGDALRDRFLATRLGGTVLVARECLIVGELSGDTLSEFWETRANYIAATYDAPKADYYERVVGQFETILNAPAGSEFNLWFGYDLFCQANMWFILSLLCTRSEADRIFVNYPTYLKTQERWDDFGRATSTDLVRCFSDRVQFSRADLELANNLWQAYKINDLAELDRLGERKSPCFPYLNDVCRAQIDRFATNNQKGRPETVLLSIIENGHTSFSSVFPEFQKRAGVYGFGDLQVKELYDSVK